MKVAVLFLSVAISSRIAAQGVDPLASHPSARDVASSDSSSLGALLGKLDETARTTILDIAHLRIDKWKTDASIKKQAGDNADSITRNVTTALPGMEEQVRTNPQSLAAAFKLYRNVSALNDALAGLTESAGAFGSKAEFETLSKDAAALDKLRQAMGDALESFASARDAEFIHLRADLARAMAGSPQQPAKKIVVDEDEKPEKPVHKKPAKAPPKSPSQNPPAQNSGSNSTSQQ
jgi:hypothetical protein